ncbi:MAG: non-canonical purine NTP pyrophosphatase, partial [Alistipes sp.]|nr:non-canonical purine NTP pyrophosphatase [Alistipes sp.]
PLSLPKDGYTTFAEMNAEEKNAVSHRGRAVRRLADYLHSIEK